MKKRRRPGSYKFTEKTHSKRGIAATVLAGILLIWYLMFVILAFRTDGGLSAYYGSAGVMAVLLSIAVLGRNLCSGILLIDTGRSDQDRNRGYW